MSRTMRSRDAEDAEHRRPQLRAGKGVRLRAPDVSEVAALVRRAGGLLRGRGLACHGSISVRRSSAGGGRLRPRGGGRDPSPRTAVTGLRGRRARRRGAWMTAGRCRGSTRGRSRAGIASAARAAIPSEWVAGSSSRRPPVGSVSHAGSSAASRGLALGQVRRDERRTRAVGVAELRQHCRNVPVDVPAAAAEQPRLETLIAQPQRLAADSLCVFIPAGARTRVRRAYEVRVMAERALLRGRARPLQPELGVFAGTLVGRA